MNCRPNLSNLYASYLKKKVILYPAFHNMEQKSTLWVVMTNQQLVCPYSCGETGSVRGQTLTGWSECECVCMSNVCVRISGGCGDGFRAMCLADDHVKC